MTKKLYKVNCAACECIFMCRVVVKWCGDTYCGPCWQDYIRQNEKDGEDFPWREEGYAEELRISSEESNKMFNDPKIKEEKG